MSDPEVVDELTAFAPTPPTNIAISEESGAPGLLTAGGPRLRGRVSHLCDGDRAGKRYLLNVPVQAEGVQNLHAMSALTDGR
jgi:hypothetical protein